ncbi:zinc-binding dehydrogenase [Actinomycetota bacterium]
MKALLCYNEKDFRIEEIEKPEISDDEMLIELLYCGLCGSDIVRIFNTKGKPSVYGHEVIGKVVEVGAKVKKFKIGDIVVAAHHIPCGKCHYCKHGNHTMCEMFKETNIYPGGFCQYIRLSPGHIKNTTFKLPEGINPLEALFVEPLACCIRAMDRISYIEGDIFSIVGAGAIGILFLELTKLAGLKAIVIDMDDQRLEMARELGADHIINPSEDDLVAEIKKITPIGIDSAILTVTNKFTVTDALHYIRPGGQINIFGMGLDAEPIAVDFNRIYKSELTIRSSYSTTPDMVARSYDLIIRDRKVDLSRLLSEVLPLSEFKKGLDLMLARKIYKAFYKL